MMLYIRSDSPYRTMEDILKAKEPPKCGGFGATDQTVLLALLLEETIAGRSHTLKMCSNSSKCSSRSSRSKREARF